MTEGHQDTLLVNEIKLGNTIAFEAMVLKYQPRLMSSLIGYTQSRDHSEELCQKTFIRVWQKIDTFRGDSALFTWIYRIAINLAKNDFASRQARTAKQTDSIDEAEHDIPQFTSPESTLIAEESAEQIFTFIQDLDQDIKTAFTLRESEGKTYEDIAIIMDCPIGTVRSRIFRARQLILEFMNQEDIYHG